MEYARVLGGLRRMPWKARLALLLCVVGAVLAAVAYASLPSATLQVVCRHAFRTAEITVAVDGEVVRSEAIKGGSVKKWLGMVEKTEGSYTTAIPVRAGDTPAPSC